MSTDNKTKITKLLDRHKPGTVCLAKWLEGVGISRDLQKRYRRSGWLESVGTGAFKRPKEQVTWLGALYALQAQARLPIHVGGSTALALQGYAHYVRFSGEAVYLFSPPKTLLPAWFRHGDWGRPLQHVRTSILPDGVGLVDYEAKTFSVRISAPERAMLECLHLAPEQMDVVECFQIMEGLTTLRPKLVQELLGACSSVKIKRLFLYLAEKAQHQWRTAIDVARVDLGRGHRQLVSGGVYVSDYQMTVPRELAAL